MKLNKIHHVAVICSDYEKSKHFYTDVLGMKIVSENYREGRDGIQHKRKTLVFAFISSSDFEPYPKVAGSLWLPVLLEVP